MILEDRAMVSQGVRAIVLYVYGENVRVKSYTRQSERIVKTLRRSKISGSNPRIDSEDEIQKWVQQKTCGVKRVSLRLR